MLGDQIGVLTGRVTGQRILASDEGPKVETTFEVSGELGGVASTLMGTYWSKVRPDGTLYGECPQQGVLMTAGGGVGTWTAAGVGWFTGQGTAANFRGAVYLMTAPEQLAHLTRVALVYEWDVDADANAKGTFWEWK
jgi:hypothetical protein